MCKIIKMTVPMRAQDLKVGMTLMIKGEHGDKPHVIKDISYCPSERANIHVVADGIGHTLCYYRGATVIVKEK